MHPVLWDSLFMPCFDSTSAPEVIKSDCRKKATPFQMERLLNQPARLIAFQLALPTELAVSLLHSLQLQHLVQPSLAVLFIECVDDAPHDLKSPVHPMKATTLLFLELHGLAKRFRGRLGLDTGPAFTG